MSVADTAGVRIVISRAEIDRTFATVDSQPIVRLGGPEAEGAEAFFRIRGVRADRQGRVWVADGHGNTLAGVWRDELNGEEMWVLALRRTR